MTGSVGFTGEINPKSKTDAEISQLGGDPTQFETLEEKVDEVRRLQGYNPAAREMIKNKGAGVSEKEYKVILTNMYAQQREDFDKYTKPLINELQDEATSTATVDRARIDADRLRSNTNDVHKRQVQYSSAGMLPSMSKATETRLKRNTAKAKDSMMSTAHQIQVDKHRAARQSLSQMADNLQSTGVAGMAQANQQKEKRDAEYKAQKNKAMMSAVSVVAGAVTGGAGAALMAGAAAAAG